jgi:hypothetical protein
MMKDNDTFALFFSLVAKEFRAGWRGQLRGNTQILPDPL